MQLAAAATIWGLWSCWLMAQYLRAPTLLTRSAATLLAAEVLALAVHSFGCGDAGCSVAARAAAVAATFDVPGLAAVLVGLAGAHAWRRSGQPRGAGR